jgi:hypothetical protein
MANEGAGQPLRCQEVVIVGNGGSRAWTLAALVPGKQIVRWEIAQDGEMAVFRLLGNGLRLGSVDPAEDNAEAAHWRRRVAKALSHVFGGLLARLGRVYQHEQIVYASRESPRVFQRRDIAIQQDDINLATRLLAYGLQQRRDTPHMGGGWRPDAQIPD